MQVPIVFCADANYGRYLPAAVQSIIENASPEHEYHIIIFDCSIKTEDLAVLERQIAQYGNFQLKIHDISSYLQKNSRTFHVLDEQHISAATYGRLLIPNLCDDYEKIIYADIDVVFNRDPAVLLQIDLGNNYIAGVADNNIEAERRSRAGIGKYCRNVLGLSDNDVYINSGLLVFNIALWREKGLVKQCLAILAKQKFKRHDQDMINFICKGKIHYLDAEWNFYCKLADLDKEASIAISGKPAAAVYHFVGALKPWHCLTNEKSAEKAALWWEYACKTADYTRFLQEAQANKAGLNLGAGSIIYSIFGLPVWRVKIYPKRKKYALFGLTIAREITDNKKQKKIFYLLGIKLFVRS